jgi:DNA-binding MarR family transcriptional regulator
MVVVTPPRWLDDREAGMWRVMLEFHRRLRVAMERQLLDSGLSAAEYAVLVALSEAPDGVVRARELGRALGWDRSRLAHQLRRMECRALIERFDCADDARATMVAMTEAGRRAATDAAPGHVETVRAELFDKLETADVDTLTEIYTRLLERGAPAASTTSPDTCQDCDTG